MTTALMGTRVTTTLQTPMQATMLLRTVNSMTPVWPQQQVDPTKTVILHQPNV